MRPGDHLNFNDAERNDVHDRWARKVNRIAEGQPYEDAWYDQQCGACRFWLPLAGPMGADWGACANAQSPFDATTRFEHDGCDQFTGSGFWAIPEDFGA
jgi:hypothetical protein